MLTKFLVYLEFKLNSLFSVDKLIYKDQTSRIFMVIEIKCPYCKSKHAYLSEEYLLKRRYGRIRTWYQCRGCFKKFHDEAGKQLRRKWSQEMEEYLNGLMSGEIKSTHLKEGQRMTCSILHHDLNEQFSKDKNTNYHIMTPSSIHLRMNNFMKKHGVSSLPLSPSSDLQ